MKRSLQAVLTWGAVDKQQRCIRLRSPHDHVGHKVQMPRGVQQGDIAVTGLKAGCCDVHCDACIPDALEFARLAHKAYSTDLLPQRSRSADHSEGIQSVVHAPAKPCRILHC